MAREKGTLEDWIDQRGFGFIRRPGGAGKIYVHMKSIGKSTERPKIGDRLEYTVTTGRDGRPVAADVIYVEAPPPPPPADSRRPSPYARAAAVGSLTIRTTSSPASRPASRVA